MHGHRGLAPTARPAVKSSALTTSESASLVRAYRMVNSVSPRPSECCTRFSLKPKPGNRDGFFAATQGLLHWHSLTTRGLTVRNPATEARTHRNSAGRGGIIPLRRQAGIKNTCTLGTSCCAINLQENDRQECGDASSNSYGLTCLSRPNCSRWYRMVLNRFWVEADPTAPLSSYGLLHFLRGKKDPKKGLWSASYIRIRNMIWYMAPYDSSLGPTGSKAQHLEIQLLSQSLAARALLLRLPRHPWQVVFPGETASPARWGTAPAP